MDELAKIFEIEYNSEEEIDFLESSDINGEILSENEKQEDFKIGDLLFNEIKYYSIESKKSARKRLDMDALALSPNISTSLSSLNTTPDRVCLNDISVNSILTPRLLLKRADPPEATSPSNAAKKMKLKEENEINIPIIIPPIQVHQTLPRKKSSFRKSISVDEAAMLFNDKYKTADFCYELSLPILDKSKHSDLKSISPETMCQLLKGEFDHIIASYKIIDCRYPYEFNGGHIVGALNLYLENEIYDEFMKAQEAPHISNEGKRNIIIFHCEFSSERGPKQYRLLRSFDRAANVYPALQYPEIYLLEGGYKAFFESNQGFCDPQGYRSMIDPNFIKEYQEYRAKTKRSKNLIEETNNKLKSRSRSRLAL
ncbi:hypothetical protein PVAND_002270 [Polypedilum vanderplanki]|uniref:protein-tyrosine-phosphatase n=1 Tax=Polypedilum vanderplanki TaxID=319348 RepID=A0A9J6BRP4_POLVA|nr:hypothetical protein PVAND_002270 [Polypedilum vanderplanki]